MGSAFTEKLFICKLIYFLIWKYCCFLYWFFPTSLQLYGLSFASIFSVIIYWRVSWKAISPLHSGLWFERLSAPKFWELMFMDFITPQWSYQSSTMSVQYWQQLFLSWFSPNFTKMEKEAEWTWNWREVFQNDDAIGSEHNYNGLPLYMTNMKAMYLSAFRNGGTRTKL